MSCTRPVKLRVGQQIKVKLKMGVHHVEGYQNYLPVIRMYLNRGTSNTLLPFSSCDQYLNSYRSSMSPLTFSSCCPLTSILRQYYDQKVKYTVKMRTAPRDHKVLKPHWTQNRPAVKLLSQPKITMWRKKSFFLNHHAAYSITGNQYSDHYLTLADCL